MLWEKLAASFDTYHRNCKFWVCVTISDSDWHWYAARMDVISNYFLELDCNDYLPCLVYILPVILTLPSQLLEGSMTFKIRIFWYWTLAIHESAASQAPWRMLTWHRSAERLFLTTFALVSCTICGKSVSRTQAPAVAKAMPITPVWILHCWWVSSYWELWRIQPQGWLLWSRQRATEDVQEMRGSRGLQSLVI